MHQTEPQPSGTGPGHSGSLLGELLLTEAAAVTAAAVQPLERRIILPGTVAHVYNPNYMGEFEPSLFNLVRRT